MSHSKMIAKRQQGFALCVGKNNKLTVLAQEHQGIDY